MGDDIRGIVSLAFLLLDVALIIAIALRQLDRVMRHRLFRTETPGLLLRDSLFFWALVVLIVIPTIALVFGVTLGDHLWWVIMRGFVGAFVLAVWAYYEFIYIGRAGPPNGNGDQ